MKTKKRSEMAVGYDIRSWRDFPPMNASMGNMLHNRTGSWRFIKPIYEDKVPPCQNGCPAGNDIETWVRLIEKGNYENAYWHLKREEPFPAILGRVCFSFCESRCNRASLDENISIRELERFVGEQVPLSSTHPDLPKLNGKTLCVIGSGPAGMSAAYFGRLLGFQVTVLEALPVMGGVLRVGIPEYRLPEEIVEAEFEGLRNMGIELKSNTKVGENVTFEKILEGYDYVFVSPGVHGSRLLNVPGEKENPHVMSGLAFLRRISLGESVDMGSRVAVIGGGNTAIDAARSAVRMGSEVTVVYRRTEAEMPAHPEEIQEAREEGIVFRFLAAPEQITMGAEGRIGKLICCEMELGDPDESGRRRPVKKEGTCVEIDVDTVISAIGEVASFDPLEDLLLSNEGVLAVDEALSVKGLKKEEAMVFAGGDIVDAPHTVVHAVAAGKRSAIAMDCHRLGKDFAEVLEKISVGKGHGLSFSAYMGWKPLNPVKQNLRAIVESEHIVYDYFETAPQVRKGVGEPLERKSSFKPYAGTFTSEQALEEADRCIHCGRCTECDNCLVLCPDVSVMVKGGEDFGYMYDYDYCKGCGICFAECPRHAITMVDEETPV